MTRHVCEVCGYIFFTDFHKLTPAFCSDKCIDKFHDERKKMFNQRLKYDKTNDKNLSSALKRKFGQTKKATATF